MSLQEIDSSKHKTCIQNALKAPSPEDLIAHITDTIRREHCNGNKVARLGHVETMWCGNNIAENDIPYKTKTHLVVTDVHSRLLIDVLKHLNLKWWIAHKRVIGNPHAGYSYYLYFSWEDYLKESE
jgi:hypothetical protein